MTPEQALQILDQATAQITTTRQNHIQISGAIQVLKQSILDAAMAKIPSVAAKKEENAKAK